MGLFVLVRKAKDQGGLVHELLESSRVLEVNGRHCCFVSEGRRRDENEKHLSEDNSDLFERRRGHVCGSFGLSLDRTRSQTPHQIPLENEKQQDNGHGGNYRCRHK